MNERGRYYENMVPTIVSTSFFIVKVKPGGGAGELPFDEAIGGREAGRGGVDCG
jgi:hypothetical protein